MKKVHTTHRGMVISMVGLGALLLAVTVIVTLVQPQSLRTGDPIDSTGGRFGICQYEDVDEYSCGLLDEEGCRNAPYSCGWSHRERRCMYATEYYCKEQFPQLSFDRYCVQPRDQAPPLFSETVGCEGPGSDQYTSLIYFHVGHGLGYLSFINKINDVIGVVHLENGHGNAIRHVMIQDLGCCTFDYVPDRLFDYLERIIIGRIYNRWERFASERFPHDFRVYLIANQMFSWISATPYRDTIQPRFTFQLKKGAGIEQYYPVDCEEIGGTYSVSEGHGQETICTHHAPDDCERQRFVNPGGGRPAYFERVGPSNCDGTDVKTDPPPPGSIPVPDEVSPEEPHFLSPPPPPPPLP
jgi:hypothetical protein